jgi:acetyl-CoA C-acetyltransferase/acetyl-CoA acyltransferase
MAVTDKATGAVSYQQVTLSADEGPRPDTTAEGLAGLKPAKGPGFTVTGGNASQLSDGASATVIMSDKLAAQKGLKPLGIFRGASLTKWEWGRSTRCPGYSSVTDLRSMISICGS